MSEVKKAAAPAAVDVAVEDDEFEEFQAETWDQAEETGSDAQLWEDNWDDDDVDEQFVAQLRQELARGGAK